MLFGPENSSLSNLSTEIASDCIVIFQILQMKIFPTEVFSALRGFVDFIENSVGSWN